MTAVVFGKSRYTDVINEKSSLRLFFLRLFTHTINKIYLYCDTIFKALTEMIDGEAVWPAHFVAAHDHAPILAVHAGALDSRFCAPIRPEDQAFVDRHRDRARLIQAGRDDVASTLRLQVGDVNLQDLSDVSSCIKIDAHTRAHLVETRVGVVKQAVDPVDRQAVGRHDVVAFADERRVCCVADTIVNIVQPRRLVHAAAHYALFRYVRPD